MLQVPLPSAAAPNPANNIVEQIAIMVLMVAPYQGARRPAAALSRFRNKAARGGPALELASKQKQHTKDAKGKRRTRNSFVFQTPFFVSFVSFVVHLSGTDAAGASS